MPSTIGLIGGSGLLKTKPTALQGLTEEQVATPHGPVFLRTGRLPGGAALVFVQRHDARPSRAYTQPADINYPAIALALKAKVGFSRRRTARSARASFLLTPRPPCSAATLWLPFALWAG